MSRLLFRLRDVPDDEAEEVRQLLDDHDIGYFETSPGNWGISMPALWINNDEDFSRARDLLDDYQQQRAVRIREQYLQSKQRGEAHSSWDYFRESPFRFISYLAMVAVVLYLSLVYFLSFD